MAIHNFTPKIFNINLGNNKAVLEINSGDRVITTTLDAAGIDKDGRALSVRANPQTGPFYIKGAEPGDMLLVRLEKVRPNKKTGYSRNLLIDSVLSREFAKNLPPFEYIEWEIDHENNIVRLMDRTSPLKDLKLPMDPMLGSFGVAPPGNQSISAGTSGRHGGNMDYRGFREGIIVYFPVFTEGALFSLGDGHALQGDGEILATGVETSMDVEFSVDLIKGKEIGWPRGEDDKYIFTVGNGRSLNECIEEATTEMISWLLKDYKLDINSASIILGQCVKYDVGNVCNPAYTVACRLAKDKIPGLLK